jgi:hypothetical protein
MGAESIDPARKETCSGKELKHTAHVTPRPSLFTCSLSLFTMLIGFDLEAPWSISSGKPCVS